MTLVCRPRGRGNWRPVRITCDADLFLHAGELVFLGRRVLRIVQVVVAERG